MIATIYGSRGNPQSGPAPRIGRMVCGSEIDAQMVEDKPTARQLALPFAHRPQFERADFLAADSNRQAMAWLTPRGDAGWPLRRLALWGEAGSGKTHLLHVWAREHDALLLPGTALRDLAMLFQSPDRWGGIAVDDADASLDETGVEEAALLHLLNAAHETGMPVLLTGRTPPARWRVALPDLGSRLRATQAVGLGHPEDELLRILLMRLLVERQLAVTRPVVDWLLPRLPRTAGAMREAARRLDETALAFGRRVTRPLAATVLAGMLAGPAEAEALPDGDTGTGSLL